MAKYLQTAGELKKLFNDFMETNELPASAAVQLAHIVNLSVRCCPRATQGTVRKNIVEIASGDFCNVSMTAEISESGYSFKLIHIGPRKSAISTEYKTEATA